MSNYSKKGAEQGVPSFLMENERRSEGDTFISQYAPGQKEALRAVLKHRAQNAPVFKEVKVQLLESASTEKDGAMQEARSGHSEVDSTTTVAAATAAAIATTAPLLKVQSDLEAKVSSVSALLDKLQETDKQLRRVAEQQIDLKTGRPHCHDRVKELEKQLNIFMEQRIQHLEKLQQQQMNIQSHFINSAINSAGFQPVNVPSSSLTTKLSTQPELQQPVTNQVSSRQKDLFSTNAVPAQAYPSQFGRYGVNTQKSPLKTPVPRRHAPEPVSKDEKIVQKTSKKERPRAEKENIPKSTYGGLMGGGKFLEQILNSQETPLRQIQSPEKASLNINQKTRPSEKEWPGVQCTGSFPAFEGSSQDFSPVEKTVKKADNLLQDLGQLKREMQGMLQEAKTWKSSMNDFVKPNNPIITPGLPDQHQLSKPSILEKVKAPKSVLKDAEKILRGVQNNKKMLEENLEAIIRAKDGDAMYTFINALTVNRDVLEEIRIRKTVDEWIKTISMEIQAEMARNDYEQTKYVQKDQKTPWIKRTQNIRDMKTKKEIKTKNQKAQGFLTKKSLSAGKPVHKQMGENFIRQSSRLESSSESLQNKEERVEGHVNVVVPNEEYLSQVYGKPIYQGHRSTLKKAPYLRFNSPSPKSKPQRPKVLECVRGTKVKSARTQTSSSMQKIITSPKKQHLLSAPFSENQYLFSPSREAPTVCGPLEGHLIPMAIPLGQTRANGISPQPAGVIISKPHPVTVTTSVPPTFPKLQRQAMKKPNIAVVEMKSEKKDPPKLTVQVLPNVDIDSISSASVSLNEASLHSEAALPPVSTQIQTPEHEHYEEEDIKFPGTNFIDVTDVMQDQEEEEEEDGIPAFSEPVLEFNRQAEVVSQKYNGPAFPPMAPAPVPQHAADILDEIIERRETIENQLISWVEQEVMARIISGMYPVRKEAVPSISASESEDSEAVTSDIIEAAGGGGFQLFVNAGLPVDLEMINHLVSEALTETVAIMLGDRDHSMSPPATNVLPSMTVLPECEISTPLATPCDTPPLEKEPSPVKTPDSSLSVTELGGEVLVHQQTKESGFEIPGATSPVGTPAATPVDTPPKITTPTPPASEPGFDATKMESPKPPNPWGDAELPLEEEKPSPLNEETFHPKPIVMSVAKDEEPDTLVLPASLEPVRPLASVPCEPKIPSPGHTLSSGPSTQESSITATETETETGDRFISEGEVLFSYGQMIAARVLAEGLSLPNLSESLCSTLHDAHEMDYDPPSEGQVIRRPHKGYHRDPVLSLLARLNQAPVTAQEVIYHSEDSDNSIGELSEGQRPRLTRAAESILMGHSVYIDQPAGLDQPAEQRPHSVPSPGQCERTAADACHGTMTMAELVLQPFSNPVPQMTQAGDGNVYLSEDTSQKQSQEAVHMEPVRSRVIRVRTKSEVAQQQDSHGDVDRTEVEPNKYLTSLLAGEESVPHLSSLASPAKMSVMLPSMNIDDDHTQSISTIHEDSGSSGADTF
ncbi:protein TALPID3 isoform X3 [Alligator sinensis]|uniref:Protein TALPID3 isoform X3 n=2 Tax=Alligator sinensis TaxID=38654 RepID=A0A3Q0GU09_ALLSI|nr:protein TALPID3 isoform X3 [Alligator sinensis]